MAYLLTSTITRNVNKISLVVPSNIHKSMLQYLKSVKSMLYLIKYKTLINSKV
jgi:hypothetical protein